MKAAKSHNLPSAKWRLRKASGVVLGWVQKHENREHWWGKSQEKTNVSVQASNQREFSLPLPFGSIQILNRLEDALPHWGGPSALLSLPIQILISSGNTLTDTPEITFNQISGHP